MSTIRMSEQEVRRAGLTKTKTRSTKKSEPRAGAVSRCKACGVEFTSDAAETRHVNETGHARYESVMA